MPTILVRSGRNPYEVFAAVGVLCITVYALVRGAPSESIDEGLDTGQRVAWSVLCAMGAAVVLSGLYWPRSPTTGLLIERAGQVMLAFAIAAYLVVLCTMRTFDQSGVVMTMGCAVVFGAAGRAWQITRGLRHIRAAIGGT